MTQIFGDVFFCYYIIFNVEEYSNMYGQYSQIMQIKHETFSCDVQVTTQSD